MSRDRAGRLTEWRRDDRHMPTALIAGPVNTAQPLAMALRETGIAAWSDRAGRVSADFTSLDWADVLVVIDSSPQQDMRGLRPFLEFRGPSLLIVSEQLEAGAVSRYLEAGYDMVMAEPAELPEVVARVQRLVARAASRRWYVPATA